MAKQTGNTHSVACTAPFTTQAHQKAARDFPKWVEETGMPITLMETDKGRVIGRADKGKMNVLDQEEFDKFRSRAADHRA